MTRQLASIRTVAELLPISGADKIELAKVDGWQCVVKKGEFQIGDKAIFFEIDSLLPAEDSRFAFMAPRKFRVKTIKLRGQLSQGLLLPLQGLSEAERARLDGGEPIQDILGVTHWEPAHAFLYGNQKGNFPRHLFPKTDQERIQNIPWVLQGAYTADFEITEKLDGCSATFFYHKEILEDGTEQIYAGGCSRNFELKMEEGSAWSHIWNTNNLEHKLKQLGRNLAIQGEIVAPRIQGNKYKRDGAYFYVFDIWDISEQRYLTFTERYDIVAKLGLNHVPLMLYKLNAPLDLESVLALANGKSELNPDISREGLVFKALDGRSSFKVISNNFLLEYGD